MAEEELMLRAADSHCTRVCMVLPPVSEATQAFCMPMLFICLDLLLLLLLVETLMTAHFRTSSAALRVQDTVQGTSSSLVRGPMADPKKLVQM